MDCVGWMDSSFNDSGCVALPCWLWCGVRVGDGALLGGALMTYEYDPSIESPSNTNEFRCERYGGVGRSTDEWFTSDTPGLPDSDEGREGRGEVEGLVEVVDEAVGSAGGDGEGVGEEEGVEAGDAREADEAMGYFCLYSVWAGGVGLLLMLGGEGTGTDEECCGSGGGRLLLIAKTMTKPSVEGMGRV